MAGDALVIDSTIGEVRRASCWWHQRVTRDDQVLAEVDVRSGTVDGTGHPVAAPTDLVDALRDLSAPTPAH